MNAQHESDLRLRSTLQNLQQAQDALDIAEEATRYRLQRRSTRRTTRPSHATRPAEDVAAEQQQSTSADKVNKTESSALDPKSIPTRRASSDHTISDSQAPQAQPTTASESSPQTTETAHATNVSAQGLDTTGTSGTSGTSIQTAPPPFAKRLLQAVVAWMLSVHTWRGIAATSFLIALTVYALWDSDHARLRTIIQQHAAHLAELQGTIAQMQKEHEAYRLQTADRIAGLEAALAQRDATIAALQEERDAWQKTAREHQRENELLNTRIQSFSRMAGDQSARILDLERSERELREKTAQQEALIQRLQNDMKATSADIHALRVTESRLRRDLDARDSELAVAQRSIAALKQQVEQERARAQELQAEIARLKALILTPQQSQREQRRTD
ncbi:MAG: hypothetical protein N3A02_01535 [Rectinema sp.]|nr:hypothetical protein [Rectinema sp.]